MKLGIAPRSERSNVFQGGLSKATVALAVCLTGCGANERPKTIPISGRVTIDGQAPGEFGKLFFTPTEAAEGYAKRPASGSFGPQGDYRVMSWTPDDGLVPGHYLVNVLPGDPAKTNVPPEYQDSSTSGLEVNVPADQAKIDYDIEIRRGTSRSPSATTYR
jgi:hypothetical protein